MPTKLEYFWAFYAYYLGQPFEYRQAIDINRVIIEEDYDHFDLVPKKIVAGLKNAK